MKSTIYKAIKNEAARRDNAFKAFSEADHPDARGVFDLHNAAVKDLVAEYKAAGGCRPVDQFVKEAP